MRATKYNLDAVSTDVYLGELAQLRMGLCCINQFSLLMNCAYEGKAISADTSNHLEHLPDKPPELAGLESFLYELGYNSPT